MEAPSPPCHDVITAQLTVMQRRIPELKWTGHPALGSLGSRRHKSFLWHFIFLVHLFLTALGLHCRMRTSSSCGEQGLRSSHGAQASVAGEHGPQVAEVQAISCPLARGVFPDQGLNPCPLPWQVDA